jgi:hypothetical protein
MDGLPLPSKLGILLPSKPSGRSLLSKSGLLLPSKPSGRFLPELSEPSSEVDLSGLLLPPSEVDLSGRVLPSLPSDDVDISGRVPPGKFILFPLLLLPDVHQRIISTIISAVNTARITIQGHNFFLFFMLTLLHAMISRRNAENR